MDMTFHIYITPKLQFKNYITIFLLFFGNYLFNRGKVCNFAAKIFYITPLHFTTETQNKLY